MSMVLVPHCSGQMCNRIVFFARALATALDCGRDMTCFFGGEILRFSDLHPEALGNVRVHCWRWFGSKIVDGVCGLFPPRNEDEEVRLRRLAARLSFLPIVLCNWRFQNKAGMRRHRAAICAYLRAKDSLVVRARQVVAKAREVAAVVAGVHVRRGDYRTWQAGRFYFTDEEYVRLMHEFEVAVGKPVKFLMVSNEPLDIPFFRSQGLSVENVSGSAAEDVVLLSECDFILGPASTFSAWAAYYGGKPIYRITDKSARVDLDKFKVIEAV